MSLVIHRNPPNWNGVKTAAIGFMSFPDSKTGKAMLEEACRALKSEGFQSVIGPMDGNTWGKYRLPIWSDGSAPFAMEPQGTETDLASYRAAGFDIVETHTSATAATGSRGWSKAAPGVTTASWNGKDAEQLLARAHAIVSSGFAETPFYTPLPRNRFIGAYLPLLARADPRFILEATSDSGATVGLTLAFPDPLRKGAIILKTYVGTVPGAGRAMADVIHAAAGELGFTEVVHALMRDGIISQNQSRKFGGVVFRRYALMGRLL